MLSVLRKELSLNKSPLQCLLDKLWVFKNIALDNVDRLCIGKTLDVCSVFREHLEMCFVLHTVVSASHYLQERLI